MRPEGRWSIQRSPGSRSRNFRTCQGLRPRRVGRALAVARPAVLPSDKQTSSAPGIRTVSRLDGWPVRSPADASPASSRTRAHGSGPVWFATPSPQWTCTTYSLPVSRRTCFRSSFGHSPARFHPNFFIRRSPPQLFTAAARTGLRPAPESRSRGADPHLSRSFTTVLAHVELLPLLCSTLSSMKTSLSGSRSSCPSNHSRRFFSTSGRCCSVACAVFF